MKNQLLLILLLIICPAVSQAQATCTDSSLRNQYSIPATDFAAHHTVVADDGGTLITGSFENIPAEKAAFLLRNDPAGNVVWCKKLVWGTKPLQMARVQELTDKTILLTGQSLDPVTGQYFIILIKLDNNGALLWSRTCQQDSPLKNTDGLLIYTATEGNSGELIVSWRGVHQQADGNDHAYATVCRLLPNGQTIWSRTFATYKNQVAVSVSGVFVNNNEVLITGQVTDDLAAAACSGSGHFFLMRLDYQSGSLSQLTSYCYSEVSNNVLLFPNPEIFYGAQQLNDGKLALFGLFQYFDQQVYYYNLLVNDQFAYIRSTIYSIPQAVARINSRIQVMPDGNTYLSAANNQRKQVYLATLSGDDNMIRQRKIPFTIDNGSFENYYHFTQRQGDQFLLTSAYRLAGQPVIELDQLRADDPATDPCLGSDTAFIQQQPFAIKSLNWSWDNVLSNSVVNTLTSLAITDVQVTRSLICKQVSRCDDITITGTDTICQAGQPVTFTVTRNPGCLRSINWQGNSTWFQSMVLKNDTAISITFNQPALRPESLYIYANAGHCSTTADSLLVTLLPASFTLGKDTVICSEQSIALTPGNWFTGYQWQDGSTDTVFTATQPGTYFVQAISHCGDLLKDTLVVLPPKRVVLSNDTTLCEGTLVTLDAGTGFSSYNWNTGVTLPSIRATQPGIYSVEVEDAYGCTSTDTVQITASANCTDMIRFPSAFSPNDDGRNDAFKPLIRGQLTLYQLSIYNRWGQLVFDTGNSLKSWNGLLSGKRQPAGTFIWVCRYQFAGDKVKTEKGIVLLTP